MKPISCLPFLALLSCSPDVGSLTGCVDLPQMAYSRPQADIIVDTRHVNCQEAREWVEEQLKCRLAIWIGDCQPGFGCVDEFAAYEAGSIGEAVAREAERLGLECVPVED